MNILNYQHFYFVGIKGVAMTSMAELLSGVEKHIRGSDTPEEFVTQSVLEKLGIKIDTSFESKIPPQTECVIYTAAHGGPENPQVFQAKKLGLPTLSHAEALASIFNQKKGIAVCGVGGKSTTSAMLAWIFTKTKREISYAVGVSEIMGLKTSGKWSKNSEYFVAEADEYIANPGAKDRGEEIIPRFSYLKPKIIISKRILFDHPDAYSDFDDTLRVFNQFFNKLKTGDTLILPKTERKKLDGWQKSDIWDYGEDKDSTFRAHYETPLGGSKKASYIVDPITKKKLPIKLKVPGKYNFDNALSAIIGAYAAGIPLQESIEAIASFASTKRRLEFVGKKDGVYYYDDYAHHPNEIASVLEGLRELHPDKKQVVVFQPHTYTRTEKLFVDFVNTLAKVDLLILDQIFSSAREKANTEISSPILAKAIKIKNPKLIVHEANGIADVAEKLKTVVDQDCVCITLGAGDIYKVHERI